MANDANLMENRHKWSLYMLIYRLTKQTQPFAQNKPSNEKLIVYLRKSFFTFKNLLVLRFREVYSGCHPMASLTLKKTLILVFIFTSLVRSTKPLFIMRILLTRFSLLCLHMKNDLFAL